jgi:hypothetical protein
MLLLTSFGGNLSSKVEIRVHIPGNGR